MWMDSPFLTFGGFHKNLHDGTAFLFKKIFGGILLIGLEGPLDYAES